MRYRVLPLFLLVLAAVLIGGCTQNATPPVTPAPTAVATPAATPSPVATFALGQEYLHKKYSFPTDKTTYPAEQFRITNDPWGIDLTVNPMSADPKTAWFEITATNIDTGHSDTFRYDPTKSPEKHLQFPMYYGGPYKFDMKGNLVSVDVVIAKRNP